ncbi:MAG TPA: phospho-N-acetylmuramoyl-pentapeptide-transferase [Acidobacteriota bacterium]|jgi:phospho-N-acetylmuramoyl-pentapeptide-transferase|nr:phospho-N-acetylmuramoyl-pentapeptide-transferase [Acidobacteriota bacterium]
MIYHLLYRFHQEFTVLNVFRYITFRTVWASLTALILSLILGPWLIRQLQEFQIGQYIREEGPASHQTKAGTPTMGGVLVVVSVLVPTLLWADLTNYYVWIAMGAFFFFGVIGFLDDYLKTIHKRSLGLTPRAKLVSQILVAEVIAGILIVLHEHGLYSARLSVPFFKKITPLMDLQIGGYSTYLPLIIFIILVIVFSCNAVNLTDGLDGLAAGSVVIAASALTVLTYVTGHATFAVYLDLIKNVYASELTIFCGSIVGASIGFLWYNCYPAEIFMGDVGAMALGGAIGTVAVLIKQELLLPFIGGIFVIEALSVILQVSSYKTRGKRIFRMAPVHHHFELAGWREPKVVVRFWIIALIFALFSLTTLKLR